MSEIINSTYLTLDGVIEHPETWPDMGGFGPRATRSRPASSSDALP